MKLSLIVLAASVAASSAGNLRTLKGSNKGATAKEAAEDNVFLESAASKQANATVEEGVEPEPIAFSTAKIETAKKKKPKKPENSRVKDAKEGKENAKKSLPYAYTPPSAQQCLEALGNTLTNDQIRWTFTSWTLPQLAADGWAFEGVPRPDLRSPTRYWSELCNGDPICEIACPTEQVKITGPHDTDPEYATFQSEVFNTAQNETFRDDPAVVLEAYVPGTPEEREEFLEENVAGIGIFSRADYDADSIENGGHLISVDTPDLSSDLVVAYIMPMTAQTCILSLGGSLTYDQLRWAFTSYSLAELQADGWDFTGVPNPDFISPTRYWSELCDVSVVDNPCIKACPARQVKIAGLNSTSVVYGEFKSAILTGPDESFRDDATKVENPYVEFTTAEEAIKYAKEHNDALVLVDFGHYLEESDKLTGTTIAVDGSSDGVRPDYKTVVRAPSYPLNTTIITYGVSPKTAKTCVAALGGSLSIPRLRWCFTDYSLGELIADGWDFVGEVDNADLYNPTRYWDELCDQNSPSGLGCLNACATKQVGVAGRNSSTSTAVSDVETFILTGTGEGLRTSPIFEPYAPVPAGDEISQYTYDNPLTLTIIDNNEIDRKFVNPVSNDTSGIIAVAI